MRRCVCVLVVALAFAGCGDLNESVESVAPSQRGKADYTVDRSIPCAGHCGSLAVNDLNDYCGCDAACELFDDCCNDKVPTCDCDYSDPKRDWKSKDVAQCGVIRFSCGEGTTMFSDKCGCGCEQCDYSNPKRDYKATSLAECSVIRFSCPAGTDHFSDTCGCGCEKP